MKRYRSGLILGSVYPALLLALYFLACPGPMTIDHGGAALAGELSVDPDAVEILRRTTDYLTGLEQFSVSAQTTFEDLLPSGHRVDYELSGKTVVSRPDKLRSERHGEQLDQVFFYDGKNLTLYNPADKVYATESVPGNIEDMFHFAYESLGISNPVSDLIYSNAFSLLMKDVYFAVSIGKEMIHGVRCDHLLFSRPDVDFQIWVADSGSPLPLKYVVTDTGTPQLLGITIVMQDWNTAPEVDDKMFTFVPSEGIEKISFMDAGTNSGSSH
jgi:hypothetical protein